MPPLTLYHFESCPFCQKVRRFLVENKITVPMKDTRLDPNAREELMRIGGSPQVPCLVIDGKALYESEEIMRWFKAHWKQ